MRIHRTISFDRDERRALENAALSVPIAFGDPPAKDEGWRDWPGRHLRVASKPGRLTPEQLAGALDAARTLRDVLVGQSERAYWEAEMAFHSLDPKPGAEAPQAVGLIAPGTDMAGMLAEIRTDQLRQVDEAIPLLGRAALLCPIEPDEED